MSEARPTIYKYTLLPNMPIEMPTNARPLSVHEQHGSICLWALVDPDELTAARSFHVIPTGKPLPPRAGLFLGTVLLKTVLPEHGTLVFHVFDDNPHAGAVL